jgi:hypothetical protein
MKTAAIAFAVRAGHTDATAHHFLEALCQAGVLGQRRQYGPMLAQIMRKGEQEVSP